MVDYFYDGCFSNEAKVRNERRFLTCSFEGGNEIYASEMRFPICCRTRLHTAGPTRYIIDENSATSVVNGSMIIYPYTAKVSPRPRLLIRQ